LAISEKKQQWVNKSQAEAILANVTAWAQLNREIGYERFHQNWNSRL
jgi:hypothetical protein